MVIVILIMFHGIRIGDKIDHVRWYHEILVNLDDTSDFWEGDTTFVSPMDFCPKKNTFIWYHMSKHYILVSIWLIFWYHILWYYDCSINLFEFLGSHTVILWYKYQFKQYHDIRICVSRYLIFRKFEY